ncbi:hypothetical protein [Streptomyces virginiae]|uniref:hypothetical protein n=1 Tax=Streptomyces virginiae TaxID=1961 RepID=UPI0036EE7C14
MESLDEQVMAFADALESAGNGSAAEELRSYAATICEVPRGTTRERHLGDTLLSLAYAAEAAAKVVQDHTVPHMST